MTTTPQDELQEDVLKKIEELVYCGRVAAEGNQHYSFVQEDLSILARFMLEREKKAVEEARREQMDKDAKIVDAYDKMTYFESKHAIIDAAEEIRNQTFND